jgi:hypothetical protein
MVPSHAARGDISMKNIWVVLLLLSSLLLAQESNPSATSQPKSKDAKGQVTIQGCVGKFSGDYILTKQDPGITYELQATGKTKLRHYLGQRVEVTGTEAPSMSSSSDALTKSTISQECTVHQVADK